MHTHWLQEIQTYLQSTNYEVQAKDQELFIRAKDSEQSLLLQISFVSLPEAPEKQIAHFVIPFGLEIPDQYWLKAAQVISEFNRTSPQGAFSISEQSHPFYDYALQIPTHGESALNIFEAIQMSFLFAGHFMQIMQEKLRDWILPAKSLGLQMGAA